MKSVSERRRFSSMYILSVFILIRPKPQNLPTVHYNVNVGYLINSAAFSLSLSRTLLKYSSTSSIYIEV